MIAKREQTRRSKHEPTLREIRRRCAEIQKGWTLRVERHRLSVGPKRWSPPVYTRDDFPDVDSLDN